MSAGDPADGPYYEDEATRVDTVEPGTLPKPAEARVVAETPVDTRSIASRREDVRTWLSKAVLISTGVAALGSILAGFAGVDKPEVVTGALTALVGLSGTVLGFYFAGRDASAEPPAPRPHR